MPSFSACLTWATPVDPVALGAHFEAYVNLKPTFHTLRLCNRFGKSPKAAVSRLPAELINIIEKFMATGERTKQLDLWKRDFKCWENDCKIIDHFSTELLLEVYNEWADERSDECCSDCGEWLTEHATVWDQERMGEVVTEMLGEDGEWYDAHLGRKQSWEARVGFSTGSERGFFTKHEQLFQRDFGIKVWISHTQLTEGAAKQSKASDALTSTRACLTLPDSSKIDGQFERRQEDEDFEDVDAPLLSTESGYNLAVALPSRPSAPSLERFPRAFRMLGLKPLQQPKTVLYASKKDIQHQKASIDIELEKESPAEPEADEKADCLPELQLLMSCGYEMDGFW